MKGIFASLKMRVISRVSSFVYNEDELPLMLLQRAPFKLGEMKVDYHL